VRAGPSNAVIDDLYHSDELARVCAERFVHGDEGLSATPLEAGTDGKYIVIFSRLLQRGDRAAER